MNTYSVGGILFALGGIVFLCGALIQWKIAAINERMKRIRLTVTSVPISDPPADKRSAGIYQKYYVRRTDGRDLPGGKHEGCFLFVLDVDHDPHARPAVEAYLRSCKDEYPVLSEELRGYLAGLREFGK